MTTSARSVTLYEQMNASAGDGFSALLAMDGVEPALVSEDWFYNNYRWIVWKLASYEVALPRHFAARWGWG